jgi:hypothetical protein
MRRFPRIVIARLSVFLPRHDEPVEPPQRSRFNHLRLARNSADLRRFLARPRRFEIKPVAFRFAFNSRNT